MRNCKDPHWVAYQAQRVDASRRGIGFELTFLDWLRIWVSSGHWEERGNKKGQYCMARTGDVGPYKVGNVRITTTDNNLEEQWEKPGYREFMSEVSSRKAGRKHSEQHNAKIGRSLLYNQNALGGKSKTGQHWKFSDAVKATMSMSQRRRRQREAAQPSNRGKMKWITDGKRNKNWYPGDTLPQGWRFGRTMPVKRDSRGVFISNQPEPV